MKRFYKNGNLLIYILSCCLTCWALDPRIFKLWHFAIRTVQDLHFSKDWTFYNFDILQFRLSKSLAWDDSDAVRYRSSMLRTQFQYLIFHNFDNLQFWAIHQKMDCTFSNKDADTGVTKIMYTIYRTLMLRKYERLEREYIILALWPCQYLRWWLYKLP